MRGTQLLRQRIQDETAELREELDRLRADAENFHMAYRMKCDKETKAQAVEIDRLRAENAALREQLKVLRGMTQAALNAASAAHRGDEEWATINELQSMLAAAKEPK